MAARRLRELWLLREQDDHGAERGDASYDPLGRLYQLTSGATTTRFLHDGMTLIAEYNGSNVLQRRFVHGPGVDEPLIWYEGASIRRYFHADERGSVVAVTDSGGALVATRNRYDEYGVPQGTLTGRFGYTGQAWLPEIGMYHYRVRIYNPSLGRFMQTDPVGYAGGMNLYAYVRNDPVNWVDPMGLGSDDCPKDPESDITVCGDRPRLSHRFAYWDVYGFTGFDVIGEFPGFLEPEIIVIGRRLRYLSAATSFERFCQGSSIDTLIGATREIGEATSDLGNIGAVGAALLTVAQPEIGGPLLRGATAISAMGELTQGVANGLDWYVNGNNAPAISQAMSLASGRGLARGFEAFRRIQPRGTDGRFVRNPLTRVQEAWRRLGEAAGSLVSC